MPEPMMAPVDRGTQLSIVIVNWNTREHLTACLESIQINVPSDRTELIVVDNASSDGSAEYVRRQFPDVVLVANSQNRGFAGGINDGLKRAGGMFILILNPDIVLQQNSIPPLIRYLEENPDVGAIMPDLINPDGSRQRGYVRKIPSLAQVIFFYTALERWSRTKPVLVHKLLELSIDGTNEVVEVDQIPGAFLLTRRDVIQNIGLWEEEYKLFYEDVDWCYRLKRGGWKLKMHLGATAQHFGGASFRPETGEWLIGRFMVSLMIFFDRHKGAAESLCVKIILLVNSMVIVCKKSIELLWTRKEDRGNKIIQRQGHLHLFRLFYQTYFTRNVPGITPKTI